MKTKKIALLSFLACACLVGGAVAANTSVSADASVSMVAGASLRVPVKGADADADKDGIRFRAEFDKEFVKSLEGEKSVGMFIAPATYNNEVVISVVKNGKVQKDPAITFDYADGFLYTTENKLDKVTVKDSTHLVPSMRIEYTYTPKLGSISGSGYFYDTYENDDKVEKYDMITAGFVHDQIIAFTDTRTDLSFWALLLGGYQMYTDGEGLANFVGDAHGDLILVREDCPLLANIKKSESESVKPGEQMSSVTESNRVDVPAIGSILKNIKEADVAYDKADFTSDRKALLEIRKDARIRTIVK